MRRASRSAPLALAIALLAGAGLGACSDEDAAGPGVTVPSSLMEPPSTASDEPTTTASPPGGGHGVGESIPLDDGAPAMSGLRAELAGSSCPDGTVPVLVTFELAPRPVVRSVSVIVDDAPTVASGEPGRLTIPGIECDGRAHTVIVVAVSEAGERTTQSVAVVAPRPS